MSAGCEIPPHIADKIKARSKVGTGIFKGDWNMSTKQRGDVERITPIGQDTFCVNLGGLGGTVAFTRDEFRRIWEAGNAEFGGRLENGGWHHENTCAKLLDKKDAEIAQLRKDVGNQFSRAETIKKLNIEQVAEIARLKALAGLHHVGPCSQYAEEIARLRGWLNEIDKIVNLRGEVERSVARALAGEAVPE